MEAAWRSGRFETQVGVSRICNPTHKTGARNRPANPLIHWELADFPDSRNWHGGGIGTLHERRFSCPTASRRATRNGVDRRRRCRRPVVYTGEYLYEYCGFRVISAIDTLQGMSMALLHMPDIILMDLALPRINNWETHSPASSGSAHGRRFRWSR